MSPEDRESSSCPLLFCFALFAGRFFALILRLPLRSSFDFFPSPFPFRALPLGICLIPLPCLAFISFGFLGLHSKEAIETPLLFCADEFLELLCTFSYTFFTAPKR